jgi:hypothetical protein
VLVVDARGGIVGVHSRSEQATLRSARLPSGVVAGDPPWRYADWVFSTQAIAPRPSASAAAEGAPAPRR